MDVRLDMAGALTIGAVLGLGAGLGLWGIVEGLVVAVTWTVLWALVTELSAVSDQLSGPPTAGSEEE